ncbi:MAG: two-component regulator propeller domain-containing protein [Bacteroidia bacterium]
MKNQKSKITVSIPFSLLLLVLFLQGRAQTTSFISYGMEQGLVQSQVQSITQDDEGNLWIGTIAGLTKYNGSKFNSFTKNQGLAEDWITTSCKDKEGNIWFGHWAGGVTRYNIKTKNFENLGLEEYTRFKSIRAIHEDETGRFWIATEGAGVFIYDPSNNKMFALAERDGLSSNTVYDLMIDPYKNVWMATDSGLTVYNLNKPISASGSFIRIAGKDKLFSTNITTVTFTSQNELWLGSADNGTARIDMSRDIQDGLAEHITSSQVVLNESNGLRSNFIRTIFEDHNKAIWVGTIGGGISLLIPEKDKDRTESLKQAVFKTYSTRQGLNYFNVSSIFEDRENTLWIGTDLGLNQYRGERMQTFDEADSIPNNIVWSICNDSDNNMWLGTNNGLSRLSFTYGADKRIERHKLTVFDAKQGIPAGTAILASFQDSKGNMWFGSGFSGVFMLPKGQSKFISYSASSGLASDIVYSIAEDKLGNIWFGTKEGATKFDPQTREFRSYTIADGLGGNHVYRIFRDSKGLLWIGALGGNLSVYDGAAFKTYDENSGLKHKFILCIDEDKKGNLWFGCYGGGLYKYDGKTFKCYSMKEGLSSESPFSIVADNDDNIWIGNNRGIDKFDVKENRFIHYGKAEGFQGVECNPNAVCLDKQGNIWFGTIMGAVKFNPNEDLMNKVPPLTKITGLKLHLKDTVFPAEAIFNYDENNLTFKFVGVSLTNPAKVKYEYSLEGFDRGWIPATYLVQEAVYTNLPPGKYAFKVRSCNNDNVWSEPASYSFTVKPPFWQTALFYIGVAAFVVFVVFIYDKLRTRKLKKAKAELEKKVEERTLELAIKNGELAEKNKDITDSIRYAKRIQDASLPMASRVTTLLPQSFVYFNPKDIVSGDFFWITKRDNFIYIAVVDCTGHGVPGAFLSIVANNLLNQAFAENPGDEPSKILNRLSILASTALQSSAENLQLRDGMDISLCRINKVTRQVDFSGAYNSLYLIRQNKIIEYGADHLSIGSVEEGKLYTNHTFTYEANDQLYLFSDGFADQFGGPKGKKYKYHHFQEFLVKNNNNSMEEQRSLIDKEFHHWKGSLEQVDDVLILGIRL